jgi:hypothetical protein
MSNVKNCDGYEVSYYAIFPAFGYYPRTLLCQLLFFSAYRRFPTLEAEVFLVRMCLMFTNITERNLSCNVSTIQIKYCSSAVSVTCYQENELIQEDAERKVVIKYKQLIVRCPNFFALGLNSFLKLSEDEGWSGSKDESVTWGKTIWGRHDLQPLYLLLLNSSITVPRNVLLFSVTKL